MRITYIYEIIIFFLLVNFSSAATFNVNSSEGLQQSISNSSNGDTIFIAEGNYTIQLFINKSISIIGAGWDKTRIISPANPIGLTNTSNTLSGILIYSPNYSNPSVEVIIGNITLQGATNTTTGFFVYSANATIDSVYITNHSVALTVDRLYTEKISVRTTLQNSYLDGYDDFGIIARRNGTLLNLDYNVIQGGDGLLENFTQYGILLGEGTIGNITNNDILYHIGNITYKNGTNSTTANFSEGDIKFSQSTGIIVYGNLNAPLLVKNNTFDSNSFAIKFTGDNPTFLADAKINENRFINNSFSIYSDNLTNPVLDINYNYWGEENPFFNWITLGRIPEFYYKNILMRAEDLNTYTPPPVQTPSSGGGGGGGGTVSGDRFVNGAMTYSPSQESLSKGYTKELRENDRFKFSIDYSEHSLTIDAIKEGRVALTIRSEPVVLVLDVGESKRLNLSSSEFYDLFVKLESIKDNKANVTIQTISERIPIILPENLKPFEKKQEVNFSDNKTDSEEEKKEDLKDSPLSKTLVVILFIALIILFILFIIALILKDKKDDEWKDK